MHRPIAVAIRGVLRDACDWRSRVYGCEFLRIGFCRINLVSQVGDRIETDAPMPVMGGKEGRCEVSEC